MPTTYLTHAKRRSRMAQHPVRTLALALASAALLSLVFAGTVFFVVVTVLRNSAPAWLAMEQAADSPAVLQELGQPLRERWLVLGRMHTSTSPGQAQLKIPVSGPQGKGKILAMAEKHSGQWVLTQCTITFDGSDQAMDLLDTTPAAQSFSQAPAQ